MHSLSTITASFILVFSASGVGSAQSTSWTPPRLGYLFDAEGKSIRPLSGVPGAASLESGLSVASKLERATISPNRKFALAEPRDGDHLLLVIFSGEIATASPLDGAPAVAERIAFSPSGTTAAVWSQAAQKIQVWTGLPDAPSLSKEFDATELTALAVSDDGLIVVTVTDAGLVLAGSGRAVAAGNFSAVAFLPGTHDLAAADQSLNRVSLIRRVDGDSESIQLGTSETGVSGPVALAFSADARKLIVANGQSVLTIDLESRAVVATPCDCQADGLYRSQGNSVFRLTNGSQEQIALFDGDSAEPRVVNIPTGVSR